MKKFLAALLVGAFLAISMASTVGCSEEKKKTEEKKTETKTETK